MNLYHHVNKDSLSTNHVAHILMGPGPRVEAKVHWSRKYSMNSHCPTYKTQLSIED